MVLTVAKALVFPLWNPVLQENPYYSVKKIIHELKENPKQNMKCCDRWHTIDSLTDPKIDFPQTDLSIANLWLIFIPRFSCLWFWNTIEIEISLCEILFFACCHLSRNFQFRVSRMWMWIKFSLSSNMDYLGVHGSQEKKPTIPLNDTLVSWFISHV